MEITINAIAHYENGHNEHFCQETEVSDEEFNTIKQCAEANENELDLFSSLGHPNNHYTQQTDCCHY